MTMSRAAIRASRRGLRRPRARMTSTTAAATPKPTSSFAVPGSAPFCNAAMVKAPQATNSPWATKITRVTVNISTSVTPSSA